LELIKKEKLVADMLLCPGDLGDKARPAGIDHGWRAVHEISEALGAKVIAGTVGNHDIDSRYKYGDTDPKGFLQSLKPPFPLATEELNDKFWARNFAVITEANFNLVVINSSAFHGGKPGETEHGRISERTLTQLTAALKDLQPRPVNILLCHHHPHKHSEVKLGDYDEMLGGQLLLDLLGSGAYGEWMIVHGHKHHPKIQYAAGSPQTSPIVFSAGSLCAKLYPELGTLVRNQFYIISMPYELFATQGMVGRFDAWDWTTGNGWVRARSSGSGMPGHGGFGHRGNLTTIAAKISNIVGTTFKEWKEVQASVPEVNYLLPDMFSLLLTRLQTNFNLKAAFDGEGTPIQIGRAL
jgi:hypothetical protein